jgi:site-specific recombinase
MILPAFLVITKRVKVVIATKVTEGLKGLKLSPELSACRCKADILSRNGILAELGKRIYPRV